MLSTPHSVKFFFLLCFLASVFVAVDVFCCKFRKYNNVAAAAEQQCACQKYKISLILNKTKTDTHTLNNTS